MINKLIKLPTGYLFTGDYSKGQLETLSIGDYGKSKNVKADFLGYTKEINGVANGVCMPLSEKWVITLSTQYGCPQKCSFCLKPEAKIKTPVGEVNISELENDDFVIGYNVKDNQRRINRVTETMNREYSGKLINIELEDGRVLTATPEHEVFLKGGGLKAIKDLTINDELIEF